MEVKVVYDDIGCMMTLPGDYFRTLQSYGIEATPFSALKGNADSEFNNRSHRKITVIDGKVGYTGGVSAARTDTKDQRTDDLKHQRTGKPLLCDTFVQTAKLK